MWAAAHPHRPTHRKPRPGQRRRPRPTRRSIVTTASHAALHTDSSCELHLPSAQRCLPIVIFHMKVKSQSSGIFTNKVKLVAGWGI